MFDTFLSFTEKILSIETGKPESIKGNGERGTRGTRFFDFACGFAQNDNVKRSEEDNEEIHEVRGYFLSV